MECYFKVLFVEDELGEDDVCGICDRKRDVCYDGNNGVFFYVERFWV